MTQLTLTSEGEPAQAAREIGGTLFFKGHLLCRPGRREYAYVPFPREEMARLRKNPKKPITVGDACCVLVPLWSIWYDYKTKPADISQGGGCGGDYFTRDAALAGLKEKAQQQAKWCEWKCAVKLDFKQEPDEKDGED